MANEKVQQLVQQNFSTSGAPAPLLSRPVTIRLEGSVVSEYEVLARHLGFESRSALMRTVLEGSVDDLVRLAHEVLEEVGDDVNQLAFDLDNVR